MQLLFPTHQSNLSVLLHYLNQIYGDGQLQQCEEMGKNWQQEHFRKFKKKKRARAANLVIILKMDLPQQCQNLQN